MAAQAGRTSPRTFPAFRRWAGSSPSILPPDNPGEAVITVDRHFNGDFKPYVYRTSDYGATWQSMTGDLPQVYAHVAHRDRRNPHMYYAGWRMASTLRGTTARTWYLFGLGLPNVSVYDLAEQERDNDLVRRHPRTRGLDSRRPDPIPAVHA